MAILRILSHLRDAFRRGGSAEYNGACLAGQIRPQRCLKLAQISTGEFGSSRGATVCGDHAKPKIPGQWARALGRRSSLRMAIQIAVEDPPYYHSAQNEQSGERALLISVS